MESQSLYSRQATDEEDPGRPGYYATVGICLALASGLFIGTSFVLKKVGLLRANEKYNEIAGEGYGYLKNTYWWGGMSLMIVGEICNFIAYAFADAILVTPLGALSVVITTILSAIFLKERLSLVGKVSCFLCIVGSVVIVMNAPKESSVRDIQEMQSYVITPGFLSYAGVVIVGSIIVVVFVAKRWGNKNMLVYISICSWIGGLSVVATQGLGAGIIAWIEGKDQYKEWFFWVLFVFVIATLLTEIIYLNKALNIFNAALVTPTYYVYFTSTTIITSVVLFQGFKGVNTQEIVTMVLGFLVICSGVVLLQLSKSAKDVPDTAIFTGDLDQIQTIAEQEQPETEPKADAIRGTAAIVRRLSQARMRMEAEELRRLHEEKRQEAMQPINEGEQVQYEWDGLRRRRTISMSTRARSATSPPPTASTFLSPNQGRRHPPLGMSYFPSDDEDDDDRDDHSEHDRSTIFSSIAGTIRTRARARTNATMPSFDEERGQGQMSEKPPSPLHPVPLTQSAFPSFKEEDEEAENSFGRTQQRVWPTNRRLPDLPPEAHQQQHTPSRASPPSEGISQHLAPAPPPHSTRRQFSFQRVFRHNTEPSEEESVGLVKEDSRPGPDST